MTLDKMFKKFFNARRELGGKNQAECKNLRKQINDNIPL